MISKDLLDKIYDLAPQERQQLAMELWDSVAGSPEAWPPTPPEVLAEMKRRLDAAKADPSRLIPWEQVKARLQSRLKQ